MKGYRLKSSTVCKSILSWHNDVRCMQIICNNGNQPRYCISFSNFELQVFQLFLKLKKLISLVLFSRTASLGGPLMTKKTRSGTANRTMP